VMRSGIECGEARGKSELKRKAGIVEAQRNACRNVCREYLSEMSATELSRETTSALAGTSIYIPQEQNRVIPDHR
jgi:hypothetical protein